MAEKKMSVHARKKALRRRKEIETGYVYQMSERQIDFLTKDKEGPMINTMEKLLEYLNHGNYIRKIVDVVIG